MFKYIIPLAYEAIVCKKKIAYVHTIVVVNIVCPKYVPERF